MSDRFFILTNAPMFVWTEDSLVDICIIMSWRINMMLCVEAKV